MEIKAWRSMEREKKNPTLGVQWNVPMFGVDGRRRKNIQCLVFKGMFQFLGVNGRRRKKSNVWSSMECSNV
jgi:hypothetical protein